MDSQCITWNLSVATTKTYNLMITESQYITPSGFELPDHPSSLKIAEQLPGRLAFYYFGSLTHKVIYRGKIPISL